MASWRDSENKIILLDNGSYEIKHCKPNSIKFFKFHNAKFFDKSFTGSINSPLAAPFFVNDFYKDIQLNNISSIGKNYIRPLSRGLLYDIDVEVEIWERIFLQNYGINKTEENIRNSLLVFTYTPYAPDDVLENYYEVIFEYFGFDACVKSIPHVFTALFYKNKYKNLINKNVQLVVDSGFSSSTICPIFNDFPIFNAIKRVDISGKLLTNYLNNCLNNIIDLDIRKQFFLANLIKEEASFISLDFLNDMKTSKDTEKNVYKFILPEYRENREKENSDNNSGNNNGRNNSKYTINLNKLRFIVPELLFNPNLINVDIGGIVDGVVESVSCCHNDYKGLLMQNILLNGGNTKISGFGQRLYNDLNNNVDYMIKNRIKIFGLNKISQNMSNNITHNEYEEPVIEGMKLFGKNNSFLKDIAITREEYSEVGYNIIWKTCY